TATSININQTSAEIGDDWFITVTKDVRLWYKLPRWIDNNTYFKDWSITFRRLRPLITGMQTAYVAVLSGGVADFAFSPQASALDADATSTFTWVWDADGGTFQAGSSTSKNVTLRYTVAGHYMPRLTVTDSNGVSNWLTCHVFVVPADYTSVVSTGAEGARIDYDIETGNNATIRFFEGVESIPDYTFCAVWSPNNLSTAYTSDIVFVGRLRNEQIEAIRDPIATYTPRTSFQLEGFATELGRLFNAGKVALKNVASPARFDDIKQLTPARGLGYYLSEHTTLTNIASLSLDDLSSSHQVRIYPVDQASVLDQCQRLLNTVNRVLESAPTGEIATVRKAIYLSSSARDGLTTITQITLRDMQVSASGGAMYTISGDMVNTVG
ncbi:MAG: PKD domain-containing protein, partial [Anaerolineae bacterium]|nr:PKD domain-containing protein [Anaerolineae bacterium]